MNQKLSNISTESCAANAGSRGDANANSLSHRDTAKSAPATTNQDNFGVDVDDLTDETSSDDDEDELEEETLNSGDKTSTDNSTINHLDIQEQLAAAGPAGVAAAAAIATARKRKRPHSFETNPSVRKRQQTRLIRKLRACIDEYTMRVGQQAVVLITMPGKAMHNFKVFGAQPLEGVIRNCKHEIMGELEQALLEQAPQQFKDDANKHELPPLVIDGIPTPVEKMTQAQLRAFIPLMLKYSTGRGKPGWGKDTTRPPWWPETLPWANVRSDARDESEKQRISWTTTLRQIVTNCYKYHGRDDLLPSFDESEESSACQEQDGSGGRRTASGGEGVRSSGRLTSGLANRVGRDSADQLAGATIYSAAPAYASNFVHTITNSDGTVSLIQVDPANAQILTLPDGTQVRAVRLQTLGTESLCGQQIDELQEASSMEISAVLDQERQQQQQQSGTSEANSETNLGGEGQIIVTGEDGTQSCYPVSSLVSIPASVYRQFAQGGQQLSIVTADGTSLQANAVSIHAIQEQHQQVEQNSLMDQAGTEDNEIGQQAHQTYDGDSSSAATNSGLGDKLTERSLESQGSAGQPSNGVKRAEKSES